MISFLSSGATTSCAVFRAEAASGGQMMSFGFSTVQIYWMEREQQRAKKEVQRAEWREDFGRWRRRRRRKVVLNFITVFKTSRSSRAKEHRRWKLNEEEKWKVVTKLENDFNYYKRKRDAMKIEGNCISAAAACCSHISCTMTERRCCCFGRVEETSHRTKKNTEPSLRYHFLMSKWSGELWKRCQSSRFMMIMIIMSRLQ